ncbi:hypothetical protein LZ30DRAFT_81009 [Colletotrichum cereale]|nr:hypothetical protein LZ30DRAFT_81009 [Colletotrichum cereale]
MRCGLMRDFTSVKQHVGRHAPLKKRRTAPPGYLWPLWRAKQYLAERRHCRVLTARWVPRYAPHRIASDRTCIHLSVLGRYIRLSVTIRSTTTSHLHLEWLSQTLAIKREMVDALVPDATRQNDIAPQTCGIMSPSAGPFHQTSPGPLREKIGKSRALRLLRSLSRLLCFPDMPCCWSPRGGRQKNKNKMPLKMDSIRRLCSALLRSALRRDRTCGPAQPCSVRLQHGRQERDRLIVNDKSVRHASLPSPLRDSGTTTALDTRLAPFTRLDILTNCSRTLSCLSGTDAPPRLYSPHSQLLRSRGMEHPKRRGR